MIKLNNVQRIAVFVGLTVLILDVFVFTPATVSIIDTKQSLTNKSILSIRRNIYRLQREDGLLYKLTIDVTQIAIESISIAAITAGVTLALSRWPLPRVRLQDDKQHKR